MTAATQWTNKLLKDALNSAPLETYKKGDPQEAFKGLMFMKFSTVSQAAQALGVLREAVGRENFGKDFKDKLWCDFEFPIEKRVCDGFLADFRMQLLGWQFPKQCLEIDKGLGLLKVEGKVVAKVAVDADGFGIQWVNAGLGTWELLQTSAEFKAIVNKAKDRLEKSQSRNRKGAGKGSLQ
jgi:hypothetical protein